MCLTTSTSSESTMPRTTSSSPPSPQDELIKKREQLQQDREYRASRKHRWFTTRFFDPRTLSGDRTRYIFVNHSRYGIVWSNVAFFILSHLLYIITMPLTYQHPITWFYIYWFGMITSLGISVGAHRLWSHKSYSANLGLRTFLAVMFTACGQNDLFTWCRDHRLHHKFTETDADPHNSRRGFFFSHVGWLLTKKHPDVLIKGETINNDDLLQDPVVYYNRKWYIPSYILMRVIVPGLIPYFVMKHPLTRVILAVYAQYIVILHSTWFVNSAAHMFGERPYNNLIQPRENIFVAIFGMNEGFHNYHHQFPYDYRIAEFGVSWWNPGKWFIDGMTKLGFAYNLKTASNKMIHDTKHRVEQQVAKHFYVHDHPYLQPHLYCDNEVQPATVVQQTSVTTNDGNNNDGNNNDHQ